MQGTYAIMFMFSLVLDFNRLENISALFLHSNLIKSPSCEAVQHFSHEDQIMALVLRSVLYT